MGASDGGRRRWLGVKHRVRSACRKPNGVRGGSDELEEIERRGSASPAQTAMNPAGIFAHLLATTTMDALAQTPSNRTSRLRQSRCRKLPCLYGPHHRPATSTDRKPTSREIPIAFPQ